MDDYKYRLVQEYRELKARYTKLHMMLVKNAAGKLGFKFTCPVELLEKQKSLMGQYLNVLEIRAEIEGIPYEELQSDKVQNNG